MRVLVRYGSRLPEQKRQEILDLFFELRFQIIPTKKTARACQPCAPDGRWSRRQTKSHRTGWTKFKKIGAWSLSAYTNRQVTTHREESRKSKNSQGSTILFHYLDWEAIRRLLVDGRPGMTRSFMNEKRNIIYKHNSKKRPQETSSEIQKDNELQDPTLQFYYANETDNLTSDLSLFCWGELILPWYSPPRTVHRRPVPLIWEILQRRRLDLTRW